MIDRIAQSTIDLLVAGHSDVARTVARLVRAAVLIVGDPVVLYQFEGHQLHLPLSHPLPVYRALYPKYDTNLTLIAKLLSEKSPDMSVVDVGANIGDTAAALRHAGSFPIVCVEGEPGYVQLLRMNTQSMASVSIAPVFIGPPGLRGRIQAGRGTARVVDVDGARTLPTIDLERLAMQYPAAQHAGLVKIDTDGMDFRIILDNLGWLVGHTATVFFEYDPGLAGMAKSDLHAFWDRLGVAGYRSILLFRNTGEFVRGLNLGEGPTAITRACAPFTSNDSSRYLDICVFPANSEAVADVAASLLGPHLPRP